MEDPGELTKLFIEQGGMQFAGATPTTPITTVGDRTVIRGGAGVTINIEDIEGNYEEILRDLVLTFPVYPYLVGCPLLALFFFLL